MCSMHVTYVCVALAFFCMCLPVCACEFLVHMCVLVWLYSNGDTRTLGTTLTWPKTRPRRTPMTVWHERWGTGGDINRKRESKNPTSAYCSTGFLLKKEAQPNRNRGSTDNRFLHIYSQWDLVDVILCSLQNWPLETLIARGGKSS